MNITSKLLSMEMGSFTRILLRTPQRNFARMGATLFGRLVLQLPVGLFTTKSYQGAQFFTSTKIMQLRLTSHRVPCLMQYQVIACWLRTGRESATWKQV